MRALKEWFGFSSKTIWEPSNYLLELHLKVTDYKLQNLSFEEHYWRTIFDAQFKQESQCKVDYWNQYNTRS